MKQDGRKHNTGQPRKAAAAKKKPITIYETLEDIQLLGGMDAVRDLLKKCIVEYKHHAICHHEQTDPMPDAILNSKPGL